MEIVYLRAAAFAVTLRSPHLAVAFAALFDELARECDAMLEELMEEWDPKAPPASPGRSAASFAEEEWRASCRFDREATIREDGTDLKLEPEATQGGLERQDTGELERRNARQPKRIRLDRKTVEGTGPHIADV